jgi:CRISPR-associated endonuclease Cas1
VTAARYQRVENREGGEVLTVSGYGVRIAVERGHLRIQDGIGDEQRIRRIPRVSPEVRRLVVLGHSGTVTLDALHWLREVGIAFVQIDRDARLIAVGGAQAPFDASVRRGQALAVSTDAGLEWVRETLSEKLRGQLAVLRRIPHTDAARQDIEDARAMLSSADTLDRARYAESRAAAAYWDAWTPVTIRFAERQQKRLPAHWLSFVGRSSALNDSPRKATTPVNAILNYLYAVLEAEAQLAAMSVGCDLAIGVLHADRPYRASFVFDLMEPVRPEIDGYLLSMLESKTFVARDFFETREGVCRLMPALAEPLAATGPKWATALAPLAERAAAAFASASEDARDSAPRRPRTPLTQANRTPRQRVRPTGPRERARGDVLPARCKRCGVDLGRLARIYCDACLPVAALDASRKGVAKQRHLRAVGLDKRSSPETRARHSEHATRTHALNAEWEARQSVLPAPRVFRDNILPTLKSIPIATLVRASGLSVPTCKRIRGGKLVPHARHWDAFRQAIVCYEMR